MSAVVFAREASPEIGERKMATGREVRSGSGLEGAPYPRSPSPRPRRLAASAVGPAPGTGFDRRLPSLPCPRRGTDSHGLASTRPRSLAVRPDRRDGRTGSHHGPPRALRVAEGEAAGKLIRRS